jgi:hypothetical protein
VRVPHDGVKIERGIAMDHELMQMPVLMMVMLRENVTARRTFFPGPTIGILRQYIVSQTMSRGECPESLMPMIFPGMDPYLENPQLWPGLHNALIVYIRDQIQPDLRPRYVASIQERVYVEGGDRHIIPDAFIRSAHPDADAARQPAGGVAVADEPVLVVAPEVEIHESYIELIDLLSGRQVVTVIEVVSPTNKYAGDGRDAYLQKQREVRASAASLVEIDLLRLGNHVLAVPEHAARGKGNYDYLVSVHRAQGRQRGHFELYLRTIKQPLPNIRIPLAQGDADIRLDLQAVLNRAYEAGSYDDLIDYRQPCLPPLSAAGQQWANEQITARPSSQK